MRQRVGDDALDLIFTSPPFALLRKRDYGNVGIAQVIKANVIMIVTTGRIGRAARQFAEQVMRETNLYVGMLDGSDLHRLRQQSADIVAILNEQAEGAMKLKHAQISKMEKT